MINGIIKLFYSEVVKTKMRTMSLGEYELREEGEKIRNITLKIDSIFFKFIKVMLGIIILIASFKVSIIFGIGTFLVEFSYIIYKKNIEYQIRERIETIKNNIDISKVNMISEKGKSGITILITLLIIGVMTSFNWSIVISFMVVFIFTIKDIYSNIK